MSRRMPPRRRRFRVSDVPSLSSRSDGFVPRDRDFYGDSYNPHPGVKTAKLAHNFWAGVQRIRARRAAARARRALEPQKPPKRRVGPRIGKHVADAILGEEHPRKKRVPPWL